jgi:hypothetical protein
LLPKAVLKKSRNLGKNISVHGGQRRLFKECMCLHSEHIEGTDKVREYEDFLFHFCQGHFTSERLKEILNFSSGK